MGDNNVESVHTVGNTVYAATAGGLSISSNGGASFTNRTTANGLGSNRVFGVYAVGTTVYAATNNGLSISTDGGASFTNRTTADGLGSNLVYDVYALGTTVYAATFGGLAISTNGGANFINRTTAHGLGHNYVFGVYAVGATVYAATNGGGLSISPNGGVVFVNRTTAHGLGSNTVLGIYAVGTTVYAATEGGLSISTDSGASFTNHTTADGLGDSNVRGLYATATSIYAATAGGLSFCPPLGPEINVRGNELTVADSDFTPSVADGTDFGNVVANTNVVQSFNIENTGTGELLLTGTPKVFLGGPGAADFSIVMQPNSPVAISTTFLVSFTPTATGVRWVDVSIANNDPNENPYNFRIQGTGMLPGAVCSNFGNKTTISGNSRRKARSSALLSSQMRH